MGQNDRNPVLGLILIGGAVAIGGYLYFDAQKPAPSKPARVTANVADDVNRQRLEKVINTHIQMTNRQMEVEKEQIKVESSFTIPRVGEFVIQENADRSFNQRSDRNELNAARDLRRGDQVVTVSPSDIIQADLAQQQQQSEYDQQYREEYARQFVDNARRNGYQVKLGPDYRVIDVKPIRGTTYQGNGGSFQ